MAHYDDPTTQLANKKYIQTAMDAPMLERDHELHLATLWKEKKDEKALHELVQSYTRLVISIASKFKNYGLPLGDLIQEGNIGLMEAAARFEPERGHRFSTYAMWWIKAQVQDYVLRNWSIVRTGTTSQQKSLFFNLRRLRASIKGQSAKEYLDHDAIQNIAKELKVKPKYVTAMEARLNGGDQSLNAPVGDEGSFQWQDALLETAPNPEEVVIGMKDNAARSEWLNAALRQLTPRERKIIKKRKMSDATKVVTLEDLGQQLGISKERVRQLEQRALVKLKENLTLQAEEKSYDINHFL